MDDIIKKKPKIVDLRKNKKITAAPIKKIKIKEAESEKPVIQEWRGGTFPCIGCGRSEAIEFGRCKTCDGEHRALISQLDVKPKETFIKIPTPIASIRKEVSGGIVVTITTLEPLRMNK